MATQSKRLSARFVDTVKTAGMYADGDGLYLLVSKTGARSWTFIFQWEGRRAQMGLGKAVGPTPLADAREAADHARRSVAQGKNPIEARKAARTAKAAASVDFGTFADKLVDDLAPQFRNAKHVEQWRMTLREYAGPLRPKRLDQIDTEAVLAVLKPLWLTKPETASRLRGRIERVLDAARVAGLRTGENPARWRGHLNALLPKRQKLSRGHHAAVPYPQMPALWSKIAEVDGMGSIALRFLILTAARTGEVTGARWSEFDLAKPLWTVPAARMKAGREHRIPLSATALALVKQLYETRTGDLVFPGVKRGQAISSATMTKALSSAGGANFTVHGMRSAFRDWAGEETSFPEAVAEAALAHSVGDATVAAYRRGDALAKRAKLMGAWERFCTTPPAKSNVVPLAKVKATA